MLVVVFIESAVVVASILLDEICLRLQVVGQLNHVWLLNLFLI